MSALDDFWTGKHWPDRVKQKCSIHDVRALIQPLVDEAGALRAEVERLTRLARNVINAWDAGADGVVVAEIAIAELRAATEARSGEAGE